MGMDVNVINPFLEAAISTLKAVAQVELTVGKPCVKELNFTDNSVLIIVGVTGAMSGQVVINAKADVAKDIASRMMMGMPVDELNEMALSAISELGNITMGTAATILSTRGIVIDITTPMLQQGNVRMDNVNSQNVCVPLLLDGNSYIEMNIVVKKQN